LPYLFKSFLSFTVLFVLFNIATKVSAQQVLEYYPKCQYSVLETITKNRSVSIPQRSDGSKQKQATLDDIVEFLEDKAAEQNADAIAITAYQVTSVNSYQKMMQVTAELLGNCDLSLGMTTKKLKYSSKVPPLINIELSSSSRIELSIEIVPPKKQQLERPELTDHSVTEIGSVYGFKIGEAKKYLLSVLGTPSFNLKLDHDHELVAFGRSLFFIFSNQKLISASNFSNILSQEIINLLPFDERIDDKPVILPNGITLGMTFSQISKKSPKGKLQGKILTYQLANHKLLLHFESEQHNGQIEATSTLEGFEISENASQQSDFKASTVEDSLYVDLATFVKTRNQYLELDIQQFNHSPIGYGWIEARKKVLVFSPHLLIFVEDDAVSQIQLIDNLFANDLRQPSSFWRLGKFEQGQSIETVKRVLTGDYFAMQDEIQIDTDNDITKLYFYQTSEGYFLTSSKILIY
jgi:hypothetical protein